MIVQSKICHLLFSARAKLDINQLGELSYNTFVGKFNTGFLIGRQYVGTKYQNVVA